MPYEGIDMIKSMKIDCWLRTTTKYPHYSDVTMSAKASQITRVSIVCLTVCSGADQRKHQGSVSLQAFVMGIYRWPLDSLTRGIKGGKCFHLMTSSCHMGCLRMIQYGFHWHLSSCIWLVLYTVVSGIHYIWFLYLYQYILSANWIH